MRINALLPRLAWSIFGAAALFGNAHGNPDVLTSAAIEALMPRAFAGECDRLPSPAQLARAACPLSNPAAGNHS